MKQIDVFRDMVLTRLDLCAEDVQQQSAEFYALQREWKSEPPGEVELTPELAHLRAILPAARAELEPFGTAALYRIWRALGTLALVTKEATLAQRLRLKGFVDKAMRVENGFDNFLRRLPEDWRP